MPMILRDIIEENEITNAAILFDPNEYGEYSSNNQCNVAKIRLEKQITHFFGMVMFFF